MLERIADKIEKRLELTRDSLTALAPCLFLSAIFDNISEGALMIRKLTTINGARAIV